MNRNKDTNETKLSWIVVGLGNPGSKYEHTRHNIGRDIVQMFQTCRQEPPSDIVDVQVILPDTYMNLSGGPVAKALGKYKTERTENAKRLIVVHDDIDLPFGEVKISRSRGSGGQKGVEDILKAIGTKDFIRVRIGIIPVYFGTPRKPRGGDAVTRFVLKKFGITERSKLPEVIERAGNAIEEIIKNGAESAMNKFN